MMQACHSPQVTMPCRVETWVSELCQLRLCSIMPEALPECSGGRR